METDLWTEKHRPRTLREIVGQEAVVRRLVRFVETKSVPHCLFAGPPGTAKTTAAMALARDLFGEWFDRNFMELNASDERGIDVVRNQIKNFARAVPAGGAPFKILVLDEADHLTADAQHALRRTMEAFASSCRMILICNYSSRIIPPIQSRCAVFKFTRLSDDEIASRLRYIAGQEGLKIDDAAIGAILYIAEGDMRASINLLQAVSSVGRDVTEQDVYAVAGRADPRKVTQMLEMAVGGSFGRVLELLHSILYGEGISATDLVRQLHRAILRYDTTERLRMQMLEMTAETEFRITEGANGELQITTLLSQFGGLMR